MYFRMFLRQDNFGDFVDVVTNGTQMVPKWYPNDTQMIPKMVTNWYPNDTQNNTQMTSQLYPNDT